MATPTDTNASSAPPAPILKAVPATKQPPPESKEGIWLRRLAILSFWAVVVFLGLPIWYKTTAIYRADLPLQQMSDWAEGHVSGFVSLQDVSDTSRSASPSFPFASPSKPRSRLQTRRTSCALPSTRSTTSTSSPRISCACCSPTRRSSPMPPSRSLSTEQA
jgi:cytoskeletal protein RodZ